MPMGHNAIGIRSMRLCHRSGIANPLTSCLSALAAETSGSSAAAVSVSSSSRLFVPGTRCPEIQMCCNDVMSPHDHADDIKADYGPSIGKELHFTNRADLVDYMRTSLGPNVITEHRVTHPEIIVTGDTASGSWYLQDRVIVAEFNFMLIGAAFYRDEYRRTEDGWKISVTGYDRTYDATMSLADLGFKIKPGRAIAI